MYFGRPPTSPDTILPYVRIFGSCAVVVDVEDRFRRYKEESSLQEVADAVRTLSAQCVIPPPHLGGEKWVGRAGRLGVTVLGRMPRELDLEDGGGLASDIAKIVARDKDERQ